MKSLDHTSFYEKGKRPSASKDLEKHQWWRLEEKDQARSLVETVEMLCKNQEARIKQSLISTRFYGNLTMLGTSGLSFNKMSNLNPGAAHRENISFNVVQSAIDTLVSKTVKNKPKPFFLTSGGNYKAQRRAKKLNKFIEGVFYECKAYKFGRDALRDGCVWGDGFVHVFAKNGRIAYERVLSQELWVDDLDGFYGDPRWMARTKNVDREVALEMWPDHKEEILRAETAKPDTSGQFGTCSDLITITEAWHKPSGPEAKDGVHVICITDKVLLREEWNKTRFPFARFSWWNRPFGYWSQGLAEQLQNIQLEINKLLRVIQRSFQLGGSFKVLVENGSKIVKEHLSTDVGSIIMYTGTKPEYVVPPLVPPEIYAHLKTLRDSAYEQAGISQLSASSKKPEGLDSGKAIRAFNDIESERFISVGQAYEDFYLQLAELSIDVAKELAAQGHAYSVKMPNKNFFTTVTWKDIELEDEAFMMQMYPISSLPNDPAGRLQTVQEYIQAGFVTQRAGKKLLEFPDIEAVEGLQSAAEDYAAKVLDLIVDEGKYTPPDPFDDLEIMHSMGAEYLHRGKTQDLEPEKLELLRMFLEAVRRLKDMAAAAQAPAAPPISPVAPAEAVPPSELVPTGEAPPLPGSQPV